MKNLIAIIALALLTLPALATPRIVTSANPTPREQFAAARLRAAVAHLPSTERILLAQRNDPILKPYDKKIPDFWPEAKEAFLLRRINNTIIVTGYDASGTLYGALELANRIQSLKEIPKQLDYEDHPQLKLRGYALGMQKPEITYEGAEYDYLYTPKDFPFFYDKAYWTRYLDYLVDNRINTLYLWSGHPFTSLLKLPKYPEAQELSEEQLAQNIAIFHWLTTEADRRGIWILQGFYNIHLSHAFARAHNVPFHLSSPTPLSSEYTRYCISEFIREYPSVGIFMTLGEAMGPHYGPEWATKTIVPGVKDGLAELEKEAGHPVPAPPIVIRAHATDIEDVMPAVKPLYSNFDTMWKWNGESLTWTNIRGPVRDRFEKMVAGSNTTIVNIHLLSNLEPFRWGDPDFVRQTILNFQRIGIGGLHLYPLRYWDWPVSADNTKPLLEQTDRDWIWYDSWARYAWNPNRDPDKERTYWISRFAERFTTPEPATNLRNGQSQPTTNPGAPRPDSRTWEDVATNLTPTQRQAATTDRVPHPSQSHREGWNVKSSPVQLYSAASLAAAEHLLNAYELAGICAPKLLPRIGITEGNRQVLSLGMTMPQLIDAARFNPAETLWTGDAPPGERLTDYVANEFNHQPHKGETPISVAAEVADSSAKAVIEAEAAAPGITKNQEEYKRIVNDTRAIAALMAYYNAKTQAANLVMLFGYDHDTAHLTAARKLLADSVADFQHLTELTDKTYRNAAGMQTSQRQIPVRGGPTTNHWRDLLPVYQKELATFDSRLKTLVSSENPGAPQPALSLPKGPDSWTWASSSTNPTPLPQVAFTLAPGGGETFTVSPEAKLYSDAPTHIATVASELNGLTGIRVSTKQSTPIHFTLDKPAQILVGFFKSDSRKAMNVSPATEQWNLLLPNAVTIPKGLPISVWAKPLPAGVNDLDLGVGAYVVLGFIPEDTHVTPHITFSTTATNNQPPNLDWLFEN
jgi:hypothetical protein